MYYRDFEGSMLAVPVRTAAGFTPGAAVKLFDGAGYLGRGASGTAVNYDVAQDGRLVMVKEGDPVSPSLVVAQNWFQELRRLVPVPR